MAKYERQLTVKMAGAQFDCVVAYAEEHGTTWAEAIRRLVGVGLTHTGSASPQLQLAMALQQEEDDARLTRRTIEAINTAALAWEATGDVKWLARIATHAQHVPGVPISGHIRTACQQAGITLPNTP
jgi:hypothetical protein